MQAIVRDVKVSQAASLIQREVRYMLGDVSRLTESVGDLERRSALLANLWTRL